MKKSIPIHLFIFIFFIGCQTIDAKYAKVAYHDILLTCENEKAIIPGSYISNVKAVKTSIFNNKVIIEIYLTVDGTNAFADIARRNIGKLFSLSISSKLLLSSIIAEPTLDGKISIFSYSQKEANAIIEVLKLK